MRSIRVETKNESFAGFSLRAGEQVEISRKPSLYALLIAWLSIPFGTLFFVLCTYLPVWVKTATSSDFRDIITSVLGLSDYSQVSITEYIFYSIPDIVKVFLGFLLIILVLAWLVLCLLITFHHFRYSLAITNFRVIGRSAGIKEEIPLGEIINVYIYRSIWGKLLNFGSITVLTGKKSVKFRNLHSPRKVYDAIMSYASGDRKILIL